MKLGYCSDYHHLVRKFRRRHAGRRRQIALIIIDGYNLIGVSHANLAAERERLVWALSEYRGKKGNDITVVFDGWKSGGRFPESQVTGGIRVIYTRLGDTADSVIKEIVGNRKEEWIVVTSDRDIASFVWASGSVPVSAGRFERLLERAVDASSGERGDCGEDDADGECGGERRGRPRTPSRKEKALLRVLKKL